LASPKGAVNPPIWRFSICDDLPENLPEEVALSDEKDFGRNKR
jgi:hypothetical protein